MVEYIPRGYPVYLAKTSKQLNALRAIRTRMINERIAAGNWPDQTDTSEAGSRRWQEAVQQVHSQAMWNIFAPIRDWLKREGWEFHNLVNDELELTSDILIDFTDLEGQQAFLKAFPSWNYGNEGKVVTFKPAPSELDKSMGKMVGLMHQLAEGNQAKVQFLAEQFGLEGELDRKTRSVLTHLQFTVGEFDPPPFLWVLSLGWLYRGYMFAQYQHPKRWETAAKVLQEADSEFYEFEKSLDELKLLLGIRDTHHAELCLITEGLAQFNQHAIGEMTGNTVKSIYVMLVGTVCVACGFKISA